jgi:hypothetical protein
MKTVLVQIAITLGTIGMLVVLVGLGLMLALRLMRSLYSTTGED